LFDLAGQARHVGFDFLGGRRIGLGCSKLQEFRRVAE
jgi:hypothetical protein